MKNVLLPKSLPTWERGLKFQPVLQQALVVPSLPTWERGLKSEYQPALSLSLLSLPTWERGLKCLWSVAECRGKTVAPYMGAWIEIEILTNAMYQQYSRSLHGSVD